MCSLILYIAVIKFAEVILIPKKLWSSCPCLSSKFSDHMIKSRNMEKKFFNFMTKENIQISHQKNQTKTKKLKKANPHFLARFRLGPCLLVVFNELVTHRRGRDSCVGHGQGPFLPMGLSLNPGSQETFRPHWAPASLSVECRWLPLVLL